MHNVKGNVLRDQGYACAMPKLVELWRNTFSKHYNTTDPEAPFGVVTIAPNGDEGGLDIATMRWA